MNRPFISHSKLLFKSKSYMSMNVSSRYIYGILVFIATICLSISITSVDSYAVPALEIPREVSQPSGEKFKATLYGDEWFNFTAAENGDLIVKGSDDYWYYGVAGKDGLKQSNAKFKIDSKPADAQTVKDIKNLKKTSDAAFEKTNGTLVPNRSSGLTLSQDALFGSAAAGTMSLTGTEKVLVLLVSFTDVSIVNTDSAWSNEFFGDTGKTLKTYYKENSQNNFYFAPAAETKGTANDGVVRVTLNYKHPNTGQVINSKNQAIVVNAITAADAYVNFSLFDTNSDGMVVASELHILTVVAGNDYSYGDSDPSIWPHSWSTVDYIYKDGTTIYGDYTQIAETQGGHMATMGVVAHELGHDIGLPDLYDTDYSSDGIGVYSLMAAGSWGTAPGEYEGASPTHLDAWCKIQLGFAAPVVTSGGSYSMNSVANGGYNILKITTSDPNQYFLVENRQATGFDAGMYYYGITSGGIAIFHIDDSVTTDNDNEAHKLVDLEEANEAAYGGSQLDDDNSHSVAYNNLFRSGTNTMFSNSTTPNSKLYSGAATNISIGVPGAYSGLMAVHVNMFTITFNANGGTAVAAITQPAGTIIQKPADPAKTGYTFAGWYSDAGLTAPVTWPYTLGLTNITFYAKWTPNTYTVAYNGNGSAGGTTVSSIHTYNVAGNLTANGFNKTGYSFLGWSINSGAVIADYTNGQSVVNLTPNPGAVVTFYAVWAVIYYNITFDTNGGSGGEIQTVAYGETPAAPATERTGYVFSGWSPAVAAVTGDAIYSAQWIMLGDINSSGGITPVDALISLQAASGKITLNEIQIEAADVNKSGSITPIDALKILQYASGKLTSFIVTSTITFNTDGGSLISPVTGNVGDPVPAVTDPAKAGFSFTGWFPTIPVTFPASSMTAVAQWEEII